MVFINAKGAVPMTIKFVVIGGTIRCHYQKLKTDSFHDANFVVTEVLQVVIMKTCSAAVNDKVGIVITLQLITTVCNVAITE